MLRYSDNALPKKTSPTQHKISPSLSDAFPVTLPLRPDPPPNATPRKERYHRGERLFWD